jgi:hypothetical protein
MEFVGNIMDYGAPEFHVSDVCRVEMISPNVVRVSYCITHLLKDGTMQNRVVVHLDWDKALWAKMANHFAAAKAELLGADHENLFLVSPALSH